jgi:hypothetical protein
MQKFRYHLLYKIIILILVFSNLATAWLYLDARQESVDVAIGKALLPFYLSENGIDRAQSVDVHKLLDGAGIKYRRHGSTLTVGFLRFNLITEAVPLNRRLH